MPLPSGVLNKANELSTNHSKSHSETHAKQPAQDNQKVSPDSSIYSVTGSEMEQRGKSPSENSLPPLEEVATAAQLMERVRKEHLSEFNSSASPDTAPRSRVRATTPRSSGTHDQPSGTVFAIRKATSGRPYNEYWGMLGSNAYITEVRNFLIGDHRPQRRPHFYKRGNTSRRIQGAWQPGISLHMSSSGLSPNLYPTIQFIGSFWPGT